MSQKRHFVFLHGGMQGSWVWDETLSALKSQLGKDLGSALTLDVPGCGSKRSRSTAELSVEDIVRELIADIRVHGQGDLVLVGHSQAGTLLPDLLRRAPELFRGVIYISCIAPKTGQTVMQYGQSLDDASMSAEAEWDAAAHFCNDMSDAQKVAFLAKLGGDAWPPQAYSETNWQYTYPAHLTSAYVFCLRDHTVPLIRQYECAGRFGARRKISIDAGHQVMNTQPHALAEALRLEALKGLASI